MTASEQNSLQGRRILLIIGGGIAAYKSLDLIRRLRERGGAVRVVMTKAAQEFITPLSAGAIAGERAYLDLFDARTEFDIGHIRLARDTDLVVVAPATADLMAKMAGGHADDLASTVLLATDKPVLIAPAMNPRMWMHAATRRNFAQLAADGVAVVGPNSGEMAEQRRSGRRPHGRAAGDRRRRGSAARAGAMRARSRASMCSSRPGRPMSRSIPCATSPTAPPASRAMPSRAPRRRPARRSPSSPGRWRSPIRPA